MNIHSEHPFATPMDRRDPVRRLRGRVASGVTVATTGSGEIGTGLTIASIMVVEGDKPICVVAVGPDTDFLDSVTESGTFLVHVLSADQRHIADTFALIRPAPGGLFAGLNHHDTKWGPRIEEVSNVVGCRLEETIELGSQVLVTGHIEELEVSDLVDPLIYFRGSYRQL